MVLPYNQRDFKSTKKRVSNISCEEIFFHVYSYAGGNIHMAKIKSRPQRYNYTSFSKTENILKIHYIQDTMSNTLYTHNVSSVIRQESKR